MDRQNWRCLLNWITYFRVITYVQTNRSVSISRWWTTKAFEAFSIFLLVAEKIYFELYFIANRIFADLRRVRGRKSWRIWWNTKKASHTFVVHHLLIDAERFVWPYLTTRKQVIQFSKHRQSCIFITPIFKIIISPDSTFYKLHGDIYFAKVLSLAMRVRTIFRKTLLKLCSKLMLMRQNDKNNDVSQDCSKKLLLHRMGWRLIESPESLRSVSSWVARKTARLYGQDWLGSKYWNETLNIRAAYLIIIWYLA